MRLERTHCEPLDAVAVAARLRLQAHGASLRPLRVGARVIAVVAMAVAIVSATLTVLRSTWWSHTFGIQTIVLHGDVQHQAAASVLTHIQIGLRSHTAVSQAAPLTYWSVELGALQQVLQELPWVHTAVVHRVFPNRLHVTLRAHRAAARWRDAEETAEENTPWLVSTTGVVFDATGGESEGETLPLVRSQRAYAAQALHVLQALNARLQGNALTKGADFVVDAVARDALGLWRAKSPGLTWELGSGEAREVLGRVDQLLAHVHDIDAKFPRAHWKTLDVRHTNAVALQASGLSVHARADAVDSARRFSLPARNTARGSVRAGTDNDNGA